MLPDPLHPAIVHFPIVLTFLLPLAALAALWRIRRGAPARRAWGLAAVTAAALSASAWLAVETGEADEERVERIVADAPLENHEEAAERFLLFTAGVLLVAGGGLLPGRLGSAARLAATAGSLGLVAAGALVGHSGGELVYRHGAAAAHAPGTPAAGRTAVAVERAEPERREDREDREDR
jgi:uncharacterized membrane protein